MKRLITFYFSLLVLSICLLNIKTGWAHQQEITFNFTGGQQSFVVPPNVFNIHIKAWGAQGADTSFLDISTGLGGLGGFAEGDLMVTPGQTLEIFVGGQGNAVDNLIIGGGGFNGGGDARGSNIGNQRGGGGGASDVRLFGTTLNDRVVVAAGGGGSCGGLNFPGGNGGGLEGSPGGDLSSSSGQGGTQNSGGDATNSCSPGEFGLGGDSDPNNTCAGGGGGWYGGASGCGGGGGSSFIDGVENGRTTTGVREQDGMVVLTFTPLVRNVPTISEWGLIALSGILGFISLIVIRRRKAPA